MTRRLPCLILRVLYDGQSLVWYVEYAIGLLLSWSTLALLFFKSLLDTWYLVELVLF